MQANAHQVKSANSSERTQTVTTSQTPSHANVSRNQSVDHHQTEIAARTSSVQTPTSNAFRNRSYATRMAPALSQPANVSLSMSVTSNLIHQHPHSVSGNAHQGPIASSES